MTKEIISYSEMCEREGTGALVRGMHYQLHNTHSVVLMSVQADGPFSDYVEQGGSTIIYEGHDVPHSDKYPNPKVIDQPQFTSAGKLTQNGKFHQAAQDFKRGKRPAERVHVYEKISIGEWIPHGAFHLVDSCQKEQNGRKVFKFKLTKEG